MPDEELSLEQQDDEEIEHLNEEAHKWMLAKLMLGHDPVVVKCVLQALAEGIEQTARQFGRAPRSWPEIKRRMERSKAKQRGKDLARIRALLHEARPEFDLADALADARELSK